MRSYQLRVDWAAAKKMMTNMNGAMIVDGTVVSRAIGCEMKTQAPAPITLAKASDHMMV